MPATDRDEPMDDHELSRYWNAINAGEPAPLGDLDPNLAATIRYLREVGARPSPEATFLDRLGERLMDTTLPARINPNGLHALTSTPSPPTLRSPLPDTGTAPRRSRLVRRVWPVFELAAAVLIIVALGGLALGRQSLVPALFGWDDGGAAGSDWPTFRGDASRTGATSGSGIDGPPRVLWTFTPESAIHPSFVVAGGVVYLAGDAAHLYALDAGTGREVWRFTPGVALSGMPAASGETVYVGGRDGRLYAVDATSGALRWSFATGGAICCSPLVMDGIVYVGSADGTFYAIDTSTGEEKWEFPVDGSTWSSPAAADGTVYVGNDKHLLYALDAASGTERWQFKTQGTGVVPVPAVAGGTVYAVSWGGALYAIDAATGQQRWRFVADLTLYSPAVAAGTVYAASDDGRVYALDAATGAERWRFTTKSRIDTQPAIVDGTVYVGGRDGYVYALDPATGAERWRIATGHVGYGPVIAGGVLYVWGNDGRLYAIGGGGDASIPVGTPVVTQACGCGEEGTWMR
jgi:hypothetical protein